MKGRVGGGNGWSGMACLRAKNGGACLASVAIRDEIRVYRMGKIRELGDYPCVFGDSQMGKM